MAREVAFIASLYLQGMDATATLLQHTASDVLALLSSRYGSLRLVLVESLLLVLEKKTTCHVNEIFSLNRNAARVVVFNLSRHAEASCRTLTLTTNLTPNSFLTSADIQA